MQQCIELTGTNGSSGLLTSNLKEALPTGGSKGLEAKVEAPECAMSAPGPKEGTSFSQLN